MKKFNLFSILLVLSMLFLMPIGYAHDITISNKIGITNLDGTIYSGSKILVDDSVGEHKTYYQYVQISNSVYKAYEEKNNEQIAWRQAFLEENNIENLDEASDDLKKQHNETVSQYEAEKEALLPAYQEGKWIESNDKTVKLDLTKIPSNELGFQPYVLWIKVEPTAANEASIYNDFVVRATPETSAEENVESPNTGDEIIYIAVAAVALAGIMIISYKKANA